MNDDRSVRCYALLTEYNAGDLDVAGQVEEFWLAQRDVEEGCAAAADQQLKAGKLKPHTAWLRARLGMENDRLRIATQAIGLRSSEWAITAGSIYANPERYLNEKITALRPRTKERCHTGADSPGSQRPRSSSHRGRQTAVGKAQSTLEERSWVWGVIGKRAAQRLSDGAVTYFLNGQDKFMHYDHLAWKVRSALRVGNGPPAPPPP